MKNFLSRHLFLLLTAFLVIGIVFTAVVLPKAYVHWVDDVMINEFGRFPIGAHHFDWNMNWYPHEIQNLQTSVPFYLGGALLELSYLAMGEIGPRISVFSIFVLSLGGLFFYLYRKTSDRILSMFAVILYFSYPLLQVSLRGVRVDVVAMFLVIAALCLLEMHPKGEFTRRVSIMVAGALCATGVFVWISAALLAPIVLWELFDKRRLHKEKHRGITADIAWMVLGGLLASMLILIPFYRILPETVAVLRLNFATTTTQARGSLMIREFIRCFFSFPGLFVVGLIVMCFSKRLAFLSIGTWLMLLLCAATNIYENRMIYFIPHAIIGTVVFLSDSRRPFIKRVILSLFMIISFASYARTCVFRNLTDYCSDTSRDYASLAKCMEDNIGRNARIYNSSFSLYYVGRDLGWTQFRRTGMSDIPPIGLLQKVDGYICDIGGVTSELESLLIDNGFKHSSVLYDYDKSPSSAIGKFLWRTGRMTPFLGAYKFYYK